MRAWATTIAGGLTLLAPAGAVGQAAAGRTAPAAKASAPVAGFASDQPIDVTADSLEVIRDQRLTIFKGNVEAIQGDVRIRSPQLALYSAERAGAAPAAGAQGAALGAGNFGDVERMVAAGPVYYITPTQQAKGDQAIYEKIPDTITMIGNVVVTQDKNVVAGDKLIIDQKTGHSTMISNAQAGPSKRVRGVFYPGTAQPAPGTPAAAPPASAPAAAAPKLAPAKPARASKPASGGRRAAPASAPKGA